MLLELEQATTLVPDGIKQQVVSRVQMVVSVDNEIHTEHKEKLLEEAVILSEKYKRLTGKDLQF